MPTHYYDEKDLRCSPSILDGIDFEKERKYRKEGAFFIINVVKEMKLHHNTMATGVVYFHRFYMFHSFKTFPRYVTACCCLFVAGKAEETPKKCSDILQMAETLLGVSQFAQFGHDPVGKVMALERILLRTIRFDFLMDHPYRYLLRYAKRLKGDKVNLQNIVQMAWNFITDSLCTTLCLQCEPKVIAIALLCLAGKLSKFKVVDWVGRTQWWDALAEGMSVDLLEDICYQVLDVYSSPPATPPTNSDRKLSQPPSAVEASTSPAQTKSKEVAVGLPISRLKPGELKRKASMSEPKKELSENKKQVKMAGNAIPVIAGSPPKAIPVQGSDTQPSSQITPNPTESTVKSSELSEPSVQRTATELAFRTGISSTNWLPFSQSAPAGSVTSVAAKPVHTVPITSFSPSVPPLTTTFTQPGHSFCAGVPLEKSLPNIHRPPRQIYSLQFQQPTSAATQFGVPSHQFPAIPPGGANSQFPPLPPNPPPLLPPTPNEMRSVANPSLPNVRPPRMMSEGPKPPGTDVFNPRPHERDPGFPRGPQSRFDGDNQRGPRSRFDGDNQRFGGRLYSDFACSVPHEPPFSEFYPGCPRPP